MLKQLLVFGICTLVLLGCCLTAPTPVWATIRQFQAQPGQLLYQSRQSLPDRSGRTWQVILFQEMQPDGDRQLNLRLSGFPGTVAIDRDRPLELVTLLGQRYSARDHSATLFSDRPQAHIGQYNVTHVIDDLETAIPVTLVLPILREQQPDAIADVLTFKVPSFVVREWQDVASHN